MYLWPPRTKTLSPKRVGVIYQFKFTQAGYEKECIRESGRTFGDRLREYLRAPSPIYQHNQSTGHSINVDCVSIVGREVHIVTRTIKGAMLFCISDPSLNRSLGKYQLPHIWDEDPWDTPAFHFR